MGGGAILAALLAAALGTGWWGGRTDWQIMFLGLEQAQAMRVRGDWERAAQVTGGVYRNWQQERTASGSMPCCDTATRTRCCSCSARWKEYLELEEMDQYAAANAQLIAQLELLQAVGGVDHHHIVGPLLDQGVLHHNVHRVAHLEVQAVGLHHGTELHVARVGEEVLLSAEAQLSGDGHQVADGLGVVGVHHLLGDTDKVLLTPILPSSCRSYSHSSSR